MKKVLMFLTLALAALAYCTPARAAHTLSGVGDIIVDVQNELGQTLSGATVVLTLPGADGSLDVGFDTLVTHIDGQTVGGNADGDGSGADGDAEFSSTNPSANFGGNISNGQMFRITVTYTGYVTYTQDYSWSAVALNTKTSANKFTVKVVVKDELGNSVNGAQAAITGGLTAVDGGSNDSDSSANGTIYVAQNTSGPGAPASVAFTLNGYLNYSDNTQTINANTQTVYTTSFQYPFRITAEDELNAPITMVASKATIGGTLTQAGLKDSGGTLYYAATGGPGTVSLTYSGFVTSTAAGPFTYNSSGSAATITFMAAGDGAALQYSLHVLGLTDELGNIIALGGATFSGSGFSITSQTISGGIGYVAASAAAGTLSADVSGYITATTTVTPSAGAMQTVDFDSAAQYAATVDGPGLSYAFKVSTVAEELGNALVPGGGDTFNLFTDSSCTATATYVSGPTFSGGSWYAAVATGTYYAKYLQSGYIARCTVSSYSHDASVQKAPAFNTANSQPLLFALKIITYDELATTVTPMLTTDITIGGSNATQASTNTLYYALAAGGVAAGGHTGYANIDTTADTQLATVNVSSASQTVVTLTGSTACATGASITAGTSTTCKGLRYGIKVLVYDELGNSLTGLATSEVTIGGNNAVGTSSNALYYNTGSGVMASSKSGYVNVNTAVDTQLASVVTGTTGQTVVTLNGTTTCSTGGSVAANASVTCRGLYFSVRINVKDELATNVTGLAVTDMTIGGVSAAYATSTNALYYSLVTAGALAGGKSGFINVNTATDTQLASVAPGVTAQTVINMTSTVACATGGSIAAGSTTTCSGLYYTVKLTSAQEELGNAIVLAGADTYNLYTDSACSATATYVAGPTFSGASWYAAVANGTYYAKYTQSGYLPTCSTATVTAAAAGPVANPTFTSASGNGLKFSIKILVYDELGTAITTMATTDITVGGSNANQASSNALYYKSAAGGVAAGGKTGYASIDTAVDTQLASITPGWTSQTVVTLTGSTACASGATVSSGSSTTCYGLRYGIKVLVYDELGNSLTPATSEVTIGGSGAAAASSNALYYNTGSGVMASSKSGYVNMNVAVDTQIATINTGTTGQTTVTLNGTTACGTGASIAANSSVTCRGLYYAVRVNVSDELANALTSMAVSDITINSGNAAYASSSALFYALSAAGAMAGGKSGFINVNTATDTQLASVAPGVTAQTVVNLTGTVACATGGTVAAGATVTCNGLDYTVKLTSAQEELGNAIVLAGADSFGLYTDSGCTATATYVAGPTFSGAAWYAAVANGTYYPKYTQSGYVPTCGTATVAAAQAGPTVNPTFTSASGNGLKYSIKILAYNELGTAVTGMAVTDITVGGSNATQASSNALYYKSAAGGVAAGGKTGYANIDTAVDTQLASITPGWTSQTVVTLTGTTACASGATVSSGSSTTCKGLRFGIKVIMADELGNALTPGAATEITIGGSNAAASDTTAFYYNTGSGVMASSKSGYVNVNTAVDTQLASVVTGTTGQTVVTLSGTTACATGGSVAANASVTCRGLLFAVKVSVKDELATSISGMAVSDITLGGNSASYATSSALYYAATAAGAIAGGKSGFISINTATDTQLASVSPGTTAQTTINLTSTTPCNTGGSVAANATVSCDGLMYTVKLTSAQEELGNAVALAGADTFNVYTDSNCSATATYVAGPTFSGAAWYAAVANGTYYAKYSKSGYVPKCSTSTVTAAQAGPVSNPVFTSATNNGLLYALKIVVKDELASTVAGMIAADITANGSAATQVSSNSLYYAMTAAGAVAGGHSGYVNIDAAADTQLASVNPGTSGQTVITLTGTTACNSGASVTQGATVSCYGLRYGIKVNAYDELGNSITPALTEILIGGSNAATSVGNALYYNTGSGGMSSSKSGYVNVSTAADTQLTTVNTGTTGQTVINLTGTTACASGASITQGTTTTCDGLKFAAKVTVANELGTALTPAVTDITIGGASASYATGTALYYALTGAGVMAGGKSGYVNVNIATDTQLTSINPGVTAQTTIALTGTTACATGASVGAGTSVTCNGLDYAAKVIVSNELGTALTTMAITDMAIGGVNAVAANSNSLYFSITSAGQLTGGKTGYIDVSTSSDTQVASVAPGTTGQTVVTLTGTTTCASGANIAAGSATTCSGLKYNVKFLYVQDEAAGAITPIGTDEAKLFTDSACTTEATYLTAPTLSGSAWYASVSPGSSYYARYGRAGYVNTCDATAMSVTAAGPQFIPNFVATDNDGLKFAVKLATVQDELGNTITMDGTETVALYTDSLCTVAAGATIAGPTWYSTAKTWHIAMASGGTYYTKLSKGGYVNQCDSAAITTASTTQAMPAFMSSTSDGLKYGLKLVVNDTFGNPIPSVTVTHGGTSPVYSNQGVSLNTYYFNTAVAGQLVASKTGYNNVDSGAANVTPGGGAVAQTYITLTGDTNGPLGVVAGGSTVTRDGMLPAVNVQIAVADSNGSGITGLSSLGNFYFESSTGSRVIPSYFVEVNSVGSPGVYQIKVATSAATLQVKSVDDDTDPWVDYEDSDVKTLTGLSSSLTDYGTSTMYPKADYVELISDGSLEATGTEVLTAVIRDNNGATITVGPNATKTITFTISGGSVSPASAKDITATTLTGAASVAGSSDLTVTGAVTNGTATITIADNVVGDGTTIKATVAPSSGSLSQDYSTNTTNLPITVVSSPSSMISVVVPSYTISADNEFPISFEVQDSQGNVVTSAANTFTATLSGSARCKSTVTGLVTTCSTTVAGSVTAGKATVNVADTKAETITITIVGVSGGLTMGSASATIVAGTPKKLSLSASPSSVTAGTASSLTASVTDTNGNVVSTSTAVISLTASGNSKFATATVGTMLSGAGSTSAGVQAAAGLATLPINDTTAETVTVTATDPNGVLTSTSTTVTFSPGTGNKLVFTVAAQTQTAGSVNTTAYNVQVQDSNGNPLVAVPSIVTVTMTSTSTGTATFHTTSTGAAVTTLQIGTTTDSAVFYYKDTKAGAPTITAAATGLTSATMMPTISAGSPVTGVTITTTSSTDATQSTGKKATQVASGLGGSLNIVEYTYTSSSSTTEQVTADGSTRATILVYVLDTYGNPRSGDTVLISNTTSMSGVTITPTTTTTNSAGLASFDVTSSAAGTGKFSITVNGTVSYGNSTFDIIFKTADRTPPDISTTASAYTLVNGDVISAIDPIIITTSLTDPGTNPSGVDTSTIAVAVTNSSGSTMPGTTNTSGCSMPTSCEVRWTPTAALPAGNYTITFTVQDYNKNVQTKEWTVHVSSSNTFESVAAGAPGDGVFNPLAGGKMSISFQSPGSGTVVMEIYRRDGRMIYTTTSAVTGGYNELQWDGRTTNGTYAANGVYVFRLRANLTTGTVEQTGKLALFKQ